MYTKRAKKVPSEFTEQPTLLGSAIAVAVHGRTEYLLKLIIVYFHWDGTGEISELAEMFLRALGDIEIQEEPTDQQNQTIERASEELRKSHHEFRAAMTWLCSPKNPRTGAPVSLKLLESGRWYPGRYPLIDKRSENFVRYFETHLKHFKVHLSLQGGRLVASPRMAHYVDLFCACILDRCVGRKTSDLPIKICPTCGKLFLSERRQFCSEGCQWSHYWTPERRSDDKWVKDLERFSRTCKPQYGRSVEDLRKKLALPKVVQRLQLVKQKAGTEEWAGWAKIVRKIETIEKLAKGATD